MRVRDALGLAALRVRTDDCQLRIGNLVDDVRPRLDESLGLLRG